MPGGWESVDDFEWLMQPVGSRYVPPYDVGHRLARLKAIVHKGYKGSCTLIRNLRLHQEFHDFSLILPRVTMVWPRWESNPRAGSPLIVALTRVAKGAPLKPQRKRGLLWIARNRTG